MDQIVRDSTTRHREMTSAARAIRSAREIDVENILVTIVRMGEIVYHREKSVIR